MKFDNIIMESCVCELPPNVVTSEQIEKRLSPIYDKFRLPYGRLELMTGIRERRFWDFGTSSSDAATLAGKKAIEESGIDPELIGCVVHASVCRNFLEPATASVEHHALGLKPTAAIFDLSNACLGVMSGMQVVSAMIMSGQIKAGLVISGEVAEPLHEATMQEILHDKQMTRASFKRHFASLTIGSGAAGVLLAHESIATKSHRLLGGSVLTDSEANTLCQEDTAKGGGSGAPLMNTDSEALLHAGCKLAKATWDAAKSELNWVNDTPQHVFTHQVGSAHKRLMFEMLELDKEKDFPTVGYLGNTGSAALPTAFALGIKEKNMQPGERIALLGIGSGLSSLMLGVEW